jgi:DNA-binding NtrC family response regulator
MDKRTSLLCVDDEQSILNVIKRQLDDDIDILTACSADEGLSILDKRGSVDIILSDFNMSGMNGIEFLQRASEKYKNFVGIIISGYIEGDSFEEHIRSGLVFRYLHKPWTVRELKLLINEAETMLNNVSGDSYEQQ